MPRTCTLCNHAQRAEIDRELLAATSFLKRRPMHEIEFQTPKRYTVEELARSTNMSVAFWRKRIWLRDIEVERFGRSVRVTADALERYLAARRRAA